MNYAIPGHVSYRRAGDEVFVYNRKSGRIYSFSDTGGFLWLRLAEGRAISSLPELIVDAYTIDNETAKHDIEKFISDLQDKELLVSVDD